MSKYLSVSIKRKVKERAKNCCEYCLSQQTYSPDSFSIEHIIPVSKGGSDLLPNLAYACQGCNNFKYNHTHSFDLVTGKWVHLYHPRRDNWTHHFKWNTDKTLLIALSPIGRATVERLKLNRLGVVNLRKVLVAIDEHPPY